MQTRPGKAIQPAEAGKKNIQPRQEKGDQGHLDLNHPKKDLHFKKAGVKPEYKAAIGEAKDLVILPSPPTSP